MKSKETFGRALQRLRVGAGLTQEQLAGRAGLSVHNVRNWEHDHREPRVGPVLRLAQALGVPMEELAAPLADGDNPAHAPDGTKPARPPKRRAKGAAGGSEN